jgi:hypothetical protein
VVEGTQQDVVGVVDELAEPARIALALDLVRRGGHRAALLDLDDLVVRALADLVAREEHEAEHD